MNSRPPRKVVDSMLTDLNKFMHQYGIDSINFGKTHSIVRTKKGTKAKDVITKPVKKKAHD